MSIVAIQTHYAGCRFRSRLEARWAVFFSALGIAWEYEPEGYQLSVGWYLPDFWLPALEQWVEVKGSVLEPQERQTLIAAVRELPRGRHGVLLLGGIPDLRLDALAEHHRFSFRDGHLYRDGYQWLADDNDLGLDWRDPPAGSSGWNPSAFVWPAAWNYQHGERTPVQDQVASAYTAARSARFEHGERG